MAAPESTDRPRGKPGPGPRATGDTQAGYDDLAWWTAAQDDGHDPFPGR